MPLLPQETTMAFQRTPISQSFALMAPNLDLIEFTVFSDNRDYVMVEKYMLKVENGRSWHTLDRNERATYPSLEKARSIYRELLQLGYKPRAEWGF
mgnify:CR=1 FL=1